MTNQEYKNQALIYNRNLKAIKRQLNSTQLFDLKKFESTFKIHCIF